MRRIAYSTLLASVRDRMGWMDASDDGLNSEEFSSARRALSQALAEIQEATWWRDLMRTERRAFRDTWSALLTYSAGDEVYHPGSDGYYQALRESTNQAPAAADGEGGWDVNLAYWAEVLTDPQAEDYDAATDYAVGDLARNPDDGLVYQCHTASSGNDPSDTDYWGELAPFVTYIPWEQEGRNRIGAVRTVTEHDPRALGASAVLWEPTADGVQVFDCPVARPWVHFRLPTPRLTGDAWSATAAYTAVPPEQVGVIDTLEVSRARHAIQGRAALRALVRHEANELQYLEYLVSSGDGLGGEFIFDVAATATDDDVDYLRPDNVAVSDPGRWVRTSNP